MAKIEALDSDEPPTSPSKSTALVLRDDYADSPKKPHSRFLQRFDTTPSPNKPKQTIPEEQVLVDMPSEKRAYWDFTKKHPAMINEAGKCVYPDDVVDEEGFITGVWKDSNNDNVWLRWKSEISVMEYVEALGLDPDDEEDAGQNTKKSRTVSKKPASATAKSKLVKKPKNVVKHQVVTPMNAAKSRIVKQVADGCVDYCNKGSGKSLKKTRHCVFSNLYVKIKTAVVKNDISLEHLPVEVNKCVARIKNVTPNKK